MNKLKYVEAVLEKDRALEEIEEFYSGESEKTPYQTLKDYSERVETDFPESFESSKLKEKINNRDSYNERDFDRLLEFIAMGHLNSTEEVEA